MARSRGSEGDDLEPDDVTPTRPVGAGPDPLGPDPLGPESLGSDSLGFQGATDIAVLGAGVAGLTAAHDLAAAGLAVTVVEGGARCGGTHRSHGIGPYTFDVGSVFFEENHPLFRMFPGLRERCPAVVRRQERIAPDGRVHHYPFELREALGWPLATQARAAADLAYRRARGGAEPRDAEAFCHARLGRVAYEASGLAHYIARFHQEPPSAIDAAFCERRMGFVLARSRWPALAASAWRALRGQGPPRPAGPPRRLLVRPREGFEALYGAVRRDLEARGVRFAMEAPVERLRRTGEGFVVETARGPVEARRVVGAMPLEALHRAAFGEGAGLESVDLLTLFVSAGSADGVRGNVLFNFHTQGRWKRATLYSRLYGPVEGGPAAGREYLAVEITRRAGEARDAQAGFEDFRRHVRGLGLFSDDLALEGSDGVDAAYPLYRKGCGAAVAMAVARLAALGVAPVGRQGRFEYLPTSTQVVARTRVHLAEAGLGPAAAEPPAVQPPPGGAPARPSGA